MAESPSHRRPVRFLATLSVALTAFAAVCSAADKPRDVALDYDLYFGGIHGVRMTVEMTLAPASYNVQVMFRTRGLVGSLIPWTMTAWSRGRLAADAVDPLAAGHSSIWRGKPRAVEMLFEGDGIRIARMSPPASDDAREAVPAALRRNSVDLTTAILAIARAMQSGAGCDRRMKIFDGRRRYDLIMRSAGRSTLAPSSYSPFRGDVIQCGVAVDRIGGFKKEQRFSDDAPRDRSILVFIGTVFDGVPPLPVRIEFDSRFGLVIAHLTRATSTAGDLTLALRH